MLIDPSHWFIEGGQEFMAKDLDGNSELGGRRLCHLDRAIRGDCCVALTVPRTMAGSLILKLDLGEQGKIIPNEQACFIFWLSATQNASIRDNESTSVRSAVRLMSHVVEYALPVRSTAPVVPVYRLLSSCCSTLWFFRLITLRSAGREN